MFHEVSDAGKLAVAEDARIVVVQQVHKSRTCIWSTVLLVPVELPPCLVGLLAISTGQGTRAIELLSGLILELYLLGELGVGVLVLERVDDLLHQSDVLVDLLLLELGQTPLDLSLPLLLGQGLSLLEMGGN